jgi:hypothetical protein
MNESLAKELLTTVNQSGFPFQIGVRKEIERPTSRHGWRIVAEEQPWSNSAGAKSGFIDLIAEHEASVFSLVIECKRVRPKDRNSAQGASWVFLTPRDYTAPQTRLSAFVTQKLHDSVQSGPPREAPLNKWGWADTIEFEPQSMESSYFLFQSQDEKNPSIERIADTLLPSIEAAGMQWLTFRDVSASDSRLFLPVIVTNATLYTCTFDADKVSMVDGGLADGDCQEVPCVRFRKGLAMGPAKKGSAKSFADANRQQQRTLLVVNAASLANVITELNLTTFGNGSFVKALQGLNPTPAQ